MELNRSMAHIVNTLIKHSSVNNVNNKSYMGEKFCDSLNVIIM